MTLTPRQQTVCDLIALGWTSKEIGSKVGISSRTVEFHRIAIFKKLEVRNAIELVRKLLGENHV